MKYNLKCQNRNHLEWDQSCFFLFGPRHHSNTQLSSKTYFSFISKLSGYLKPDFITGFFGAMYSWKIKEWLHLRVHNLTAVLTIFKWMHCLKSKEQWRTKRRRNDKQQGWSGIIIPSCRRDALITVWLNSF